MKIVFLGPPGAGKGTQAAQIAAKLNVPHISTGDMLRASIAAKRSVGLNAKSYMDAGKLVPDEVIMGIVRERLQEEDAKKGFLFDGFPRNLYQAQQLSGFEKLDAVVDIDVPDASIIRRLSGRRCCPACGAVCHVDTLEGATDCPQCGEALITREDDNPEVVRQRLSVYHEQTRPLIDYYTGLGLLRTVSGDQDIAKVQEDILQELHSV